MIYDAVSLLLVLVLVGAIAMCVKGWRICEYSPMRDRLWFILISGDTDHLGQYWLVK